MIVFENEGEIDLRLVTTFGVCDKVGENPIGYFGTGLKYAIAVLLREGIKVVLWKGTERFEFYTRRQKLRSTEADWIVMKSQRGEHVLAFTTQLGKNWKLWQAMRELMCNTLDEGGEYFNTGIQHPPKRIIPTPGFTMITLEGAAAVEAFEKRDTIILSTEPLYRHDACEIHEGDGTWLYYRGIRVHKNERPALYNYNILSTQRLTEDRTLDGTWGAHYAIANAVAQCEERELVDKILTAPKERMESQINFEYTTQPSPTFYGSIRRAASTFAPVNTSALGLYSSSAHGHTLIETIPMTGEQELLIEGIIGFWQELGVPIDPEVHKVYVTDDLHAPKGIHARSYGKNIYVLDKVFAWGFQTVAALIFDCFLNIHYHLHRGTDEAHNFLVNFIVEKGLQGQAPDDMAILDALQGEGQPASIDDADIF